MAQAAETDRPEAEEISFELERLKLSPDGRLELTGRWFGVRGRRFVRPTLTLIAANERSRSLADLEHKPWAAEDGASWIAVFALRAPGEDVLELELAVAPDIAVSLPPPPELAQLPREPGPSRGAVVAPRNVPPARQETAVDTPPQPAKVKAPARRAAADLAQATIEQQRAEIQSLEERLERAGGLEVELRSALGRRDAAMEKLEAVLEQREAQEREQAIADGERESAERDRVRALRERDEARKGWKEAHEGWREAVRERDETAAERDRALIERDRALADRDRTLRELDQTPTVRDRAPAERARAPVPRPLMTAPEQRPRVPESRRAPAWIVWMTRLFALLVLAVIVAAILLIIRAA